MASYPTPDTPSTRVDPDESTASYLERLSSTIVTALNDRDFAFASAPAQLFLTHISPHWRGEIDTFAQKREITSFDQQRAMWKQRAEENPGVHFEIVHLWSYVNEEVGLANVYMNMEVTGVGGDGVKLHAMNELKWKRTDGETTLTESIDVDEMLRDAAGRAVVLHAPLASAARFAATLPVLVRPMHDIR
ncbi:hypothetical protein PRZ48_004369 [Zasmidium cellare]|uniref:Uncharacterized protein n=1 Tax=Zasmidium cellare TaxID=395010 RepID=A0ABR0EPF9_ZASCE|nr:hypothetical protein PRZ48_004369 [Zasmidium cellare]